MPASTWVPDRKDIIWINFSPQAGKEMKDRHPMLVLSNRIFNEKTSIVIGLPMTTATSNETNPFAVKYVGKNNVTGYVLTHQPKSLDWRQREAKAHAWKHASDEMFNDVCDLLNTIVSIA